MSCLWISKTQKHKICIFPGMYICEKKSTQLRKVDWKTINYIYGVSLPRWKGKKRCRGLGSQGRQAAKSRHLRQNILSNTHSSVMSKFNWGLSSSLPVNQKMQYLSYRTDLWLPRKGGDGGGKDWEFGISRYKLLYRGRINNKVLLYSTGNYIQCPVINHNGEEYIYIYIYIYIYMYTHTHIYICLSV